MTMLKIFEYPSLTGVLLIVVLFTSVSSHAEQKKQQADYLNIAALLIKDGHFERAEIALNQVDITQETLDKAQYYTLLGLIQLNKKDYLSAKDSIVQAINAGQQEKYIYVYLAQAAYGMKDYQTTVAAIEKSAEEGEKIKDFYNMRAQSHWLLGNKTLAWQAIEQGLQRFIDEPSLLKQKVFYLIELKLFQDAVQVGELYLDVANITAKDYIAFGSALRRSGALDKAIILLEKAKMKYPASEHAIVELAHAYIDQGNLLAAADLFLQATAIDQKYVAEAAELSRRAAKYHRALSLNAQINDQKKKLKQRLAILIENQDYELSASMGSALYRVGLLAEEDIRYALAYSYFKAGKYPQAKEHLSQLKRSDLFRKSTELRKTMKTCETARWACY